MRRCFLLSLLALFCSSLWVTPLLPQSVPSASIAHYHDDLQRCQQTVQGWHREASIQIVLTIAIIVFGAVIAVLQGRNNGWCKTTTVLLGATISIFTGINAKIFTADYRALEQASINAQPLIDQLNIAIERLNQNLTDQDRTTLQAQWLKTLGEFHSLEMQLATGTRDSSRSLSLIFTVHAQTSRTAPPWTQSDTSSDEYNFYFVGRGEDKSVSEAQRKSFDDAVEKALHQIAATVQTDVGALRKFISASASIESTRFTYDKTKGTYVYYTRLRLSKDVQNVHFGAPATRNLAAVAAAQKVAQCNPGTLTVQTCHQQFPTGCTDAKRPSYDAYLNFLKNQIPYTTWTSSSQLGEAEFKTLEANVPRGLTSMNHAKFASKLADMGEGNTVTLVAYLYFVLDTSRGRGGSHAIGEVCNCKLQLPDSYDYHLGLGFDRILADQIRENKTQLANGPPTAMEKTSIVAEMTPHTRSPKWTLARVSSLQGQQVKVVGQLMADNIHWNSRDDCSFPGATEYCWRSTVWEIHPVSEFYVCNLASGCDSSSPDSAWTSLEYVP